MARYTHKASGIRVTVADGKQLGPEWEAAEKPKPRAKAEPKKSDKK